LEGLAEAKHQAARTGDLTPTSLLMNRRSCLDENPPVAQDAWVIGAHSTIYISNPDADRAFFRQVLNPPHILDLTMNVMTED